MPARPLVALYCAGILLVPATHLAADTQTNVQMLAPGFSVRQLPVRLSNINNLRFAPDGRLFALGYDGRIFVLRDTDGDGLEDKADVFWDQPTISVPVGMAIAPEGVFVSSHGKVSRLRDTHHGGKADLEEIIASGWPPTDVASGGVDATAVVRDLEGNVYFGLLTADYSNAYRLKDGQAHYDLNGPRGTIQKWSVATRKLETVATGIRVPYTLAFNRHRDLFVTDQEGETWMPDGNPLDELNHIIPGRNYGFPPRHEKYLPNVLNEPPVVAFGPQHQSTCGFFFNERMGNRRTFGPAGWEGDAIIAGESRGKIWRTRLVKTASSYVGKETIIARLSMLTTDVALSPRGDLYVSCHSGPPDWGTGPQGEGKLFKISYADRAAPQPVIAWAAGPMEARIAFDRPLADTVTNDLVGQGIEFGEFVRAGDRFEVLKPPYQAVKFQNATPRGRLRIAAAHLSADKTVIALATDPHPLSVTYALTLPGIKGRAANAARATVDLDYNLGGIEATWRSKNVYSAEGWDGWFPHIDSEVNLAFTAESASHRKLLDLVSRPGVMQFRSQLKLPAGRSIIRFQRNAAFHATIGPDTAVPKANAHGWFLAELSVASDGQPKLLELELETGATSTPIFHASYFTEADPTVRSLPFSFFLLPWAAPYQPLKMPEGPGPDLAGGDWQRGKTLFTSEQLKCNTCHKIRGEGKETGPDLSNLIHRDAASVLRDIKEPGASINPDYVAYKVTLRNGGELTGFVRAQSENAVRILDAGGKETVAPRAELKEMQPSSVSLMPVGLLEGLKEGQVRDLLAYLLIAEPPKPKIETPPLRSRAEVEALLAKSARPNHTPNPRALNVTLVASKQDHGPGEHDYPAWQTNWVKLLKQAPSVNVATAWEWPTAGQFKQADVIVFYYWNHNWSAERYGDLDGFLARGGGLVILHSACIADQEPEPLAERIGLSAQPVRVKYRHGPLDLKIVTAADHPITRGLTQIHFVDETYWLMIGDAKKVEVLATAEEEGKPWPMLWTLQKGKGRVFGSILGHFSTTFDDPLFRVLVLRGLAWAAGEPTDRLEKLVTVGVTFREQAQTK